MFYNASDHKDPRWLLKRDAILTRDENKCVICDETSNLHIHHRLYFAQRRAWEYPNEFLVTLCRGCHATEHFAPITYELAFTYLLSTKDEAMGFTESFRHFRSVHKLSTREAMEFIEWLLGPRGVEDSVIADFKAHKQALLQYE